MPTQLPPNRYLDLAIIVVFTLICLTSLLEFAPRALEKAASTARDEARITRVLQLSGALDKTLLSHLTQTHEERHSTQTVYISLPSSFNNCSDYRLPEPPPGWKYRCSNPTNYRSSDGSGWIPAKLNLESLPIDPINDQNHFLAVIFYQPVNAYDSAESNVYALRETGHAAADPCQRLYIFRGSSSYLQELCGLIETLSANEVDSEHFLHSRRSGLRYYFGENTSFSSDSPDAEINLGSRERFKVSSFSVILKVKTDSIPDAKQIVGKGIPGYAAYNFSVSQTGDSILFSVKQNKSSEAFISGGKLLPGRWHKIAAVYDDKDQTMFLYFDDQLVAFAKNDKRIDTNYNPAIVLGRQPNGFSGRIESFQLFSIPLTQQQISKL